MHAYACRHIHASIFAYVHRHASKAHAFAVKYTYRHTQTRTHAHARTRTHTHTPTRARAHTHRHAHTQTTRMAPTTSRCLGPAHGHLARMHATLPQVPQLRRVRIRPLVGAGIQAVFPRPLLPEAAVVCALHTRHRAAADGGGDARASGAGAGRPRRGALRPLRAARQQQRPRDISRQNRMGVSGGAGVPAADGDPVPLDKRQELLKLRGVPGGSEAISTKKYPAGAEQGGSPLIPHPSSLPKP